MYTMFFGFFLMANALTSSHVFMRTFFPICLRTRGILEAVGLVKDRCEGKWVIYSLKNKNVINLMEKIDE